MWPVQTLTLLLCLTEEEQLFAQQVQQLEPQAIEISIEEDTEATLKSAMLWDPEC